MTFDEFKEDLAGVIEKPETLEEFTKKVEEDYNLLDQARNKITEQEEQIKEKDKTISTYVNNILLSKKADSPEPEEPEKTPQERFNEMFDERFGLNKDK